MDEGLFLQGLAIPLCWDLNVEEDLDYPLACISLLLVEAGVCRKELLCSLSPHSVCYFWRLAWAGNLQLGSLASREPHSPEEADKRESVKVHFVEDRGAWGFILVRLSVLLRVTVWAPRSTKLLLSS